MLTLSVQIEQLAPMRVAVVSVTSASPEQEAITALLDWARPQGLLDGAFRFFGYDNCRPYPNHTYTTWLTVGEDVRPSDDVEIKEFHGGLYAVTALEGVEQIAPVWDQLEGWLNDSEYAFGNQPGLEEHLDVLSANPRHFKLYLPVQKP